MRATLLMLCGLTAAAVAAGIELAPLDRIDQPGSPWRKVGIPGQAKPWTKFTVLSAEGQRVLHIEADNSYGNLVHPIPASAAAAQGAAAKPVLAWRWRVDVPNLAADLRQKAGDDAAAKVCVMFDLPISAVPFIDQAVLRIAGERSAEPLPTATVCYVWDAHLAPGTVLDNAYSRRLRFMVLRGPESPLHTWRTERRDVAADFLRLFGDEAKAMVPVLGVGVGADADNTHGRSEAQVADLTLN